VVTQTDAEDVLPQHQALEAPVVESSEHETTAAPSQAEDVNGPPSSVVQEPGQSTEVIPEAEEPLHSNLPSSRPQEPSASEVDDTQQEKVALTDGPELPNHDEVQIVSVPEPPALREVEPAIDAGTAPPVSDVPLPKIETTKQRRKRIAEEESQREEQERLDQESFDQYRIDQERLEMARLEQKRLERERMRQERLEKERIEQERLEEERLQQERLEQEQLEAERVETERLEAERVERERVETERLEAERLGRIRAEQERLVNERIEQDRFEQEQVERQRREQLELEKQRLEEQRIENEALEQKSLEQAAAAAAAAAEAAEATRNIILQAQAEASQKTKDREGPNSMPAENAVREVGEGPNAPSPAHSATSAKRVLKAVIEPAHLSTPPPEDIPQPHVSPSDMRTSNPGSRLPTPAASVGRTSSPRSVATDASKSRAHALEQPPPQPRPIQRSDDLDHVTPGRHASSSPALPAPRPQAVSQLIDDNRPPAPSPPVGRLRARHAPAFEDTEDDSDSAMVRTSRRQFRGVGGGEEYDRPSGSYPQQPAHHRFASRVPAEQSYPNPPPPQQPPGYHPYYPPAAPPHYQNHNYRVSQPGYPPPNPYGPSSHPTSSPYTEPWNYPPGYRHDSPPQRHDTLVTRDYPLGLAPLDTRAGFGDDPGDVFSRIAQAIPDLHVLLARYKETHGQLSVREELLRRSSIEQEERLRVKDNEIADLKEQVRNLEHRYSTETNRLRDSLAEQARELHDQRIETERFKKEAQETKIALEAAMQSWEAKYKELAEAHAVLIRTSAEEKASFDEWKSSLTTRTDAEKIALAIQFDKRLKEADVLAADQRQEAIEAFAKERDELIADHERRHFELQASFDQLRNELETKLSLAQQDREEAFRHERESREVWLAEREALMKSHRDDRESIRTSWDEQRDVLEAQYKKSKDESDRAWIELHADASKRAEEENARVNQLIKEKEELQKKYNALRAESEQEKAIIKSVATNLESEKSRLEKLMECYGDIAEIKSKGDTY
jgi:serine/arginine repetitive matrix protein 2